MKLKPMNNKGVMYAWITILASIFVVSIIYIIFDNMIEVTFYDKAIEFGVSTSILDTLTMAWRAFPIIFILGMFLYGLVRAQRQEGDTWSL